MEKTDENEIYPYPGKTRSVVWDFFGFKKKHNVDGPPVKQNLVMETAICRKSGKSYANKALPTDMDGLSFDNTSLLPNHTMTNSSDDYVDLSNNFTSPDDTVDPRLATAKNIMFKIEYALLPMFLVTGLFGNMFTIITMASSRFSHLTSRYILIFLAISDTVLLVTQPFNKIWVIKMFGTDVRAISSLSCKAFFVIFKTSKMTSSWLVVFLCFERFVAVVFPLKAKMIIRKRYIFPAIAANYIFMFAYNSVWSFSSGIVNGICKPDMPSLRHSVFVIIGSTMYSFLPTILLVIFTPQIIARLITQVKTRRALSRLPAKAGEDEIGSGLRSKQEEEMLRANFMVLGVMIAYIVLIIPITTVHLYSFQAGVSAFDTNSFGFFVYREIAQILEQINYAVNFFLYILCSKTFRSRVQELLCIESCTKRNDYSMSTSLQKITSGISSIS